MRRRNDYWNDTRISVFCGMTNQDIVREKVAWPTREDLRKLIPSDQTMMPCEKVYRHGACVVQMDKPNSRYRVGYLRRVVINDEKSLDIVNTLQVADTFHNVKYVENFVPKTGTFNDFFLDFDRDDNIAEIVVRTRWEKVKFPADYKNDIDDICVGSLLLGGTKLYGRAESILAKYLPNTIVVGATEDLNKAYDCDVSKVFKETAAVPKTVHAYAYIFKDIAPGEELYLNYYYGGRDERRQTAWVNGLDKKSDVYKYLLEDGEVDGIKFKDYWGMPVHDVLSNPIFQGGWGTYLRGQKGWLRKKKSAFVSEINTKENVGTFSNPYENKEEAETRLKTPPIPKKQNKKKKNNAPPGFKYKQGPFVIDLVTNKRWYVETIERVNDKRSQKIKIQPQLHHHLFDFLMEKFPSDKDVKKFVTTFSNGEKKVVIDRLEDPWLPSVACWEGLNLKTFIRMEEVDYMKFWYHDIVRRGGNDPALPDRP